MHHIGTNNVFFKWGAISALSGRPLKLVIKFTYLGSNISSSESDINIFLVKAWNLIDMWKFNFSDEIKQDFFQVVAVSILLCRCTIWTQRKYMEKKLGGNYTRMLHVVLNKSWKQHPTKQQVYGHLLLIWEAIQVRRTRRMGHCWRSKDKLISDIL